ASSSLNAEIVICLSINSLYHIWQHPLPSSVRCCLKINCAYKRKEPEEVGRISTAHAYNKAMNHSRNKSQGRMKK
ncbi:hypothetical protein, partial [Ruthenibacterium lactatiformans]|uniref:hypothetical protein n=1 Tax=Ruthenibacterium lactatiformans TaxID=1550024 RepID=UPI0019D55D56